MMSETPRKGDDPTLPSNRAFSYVDAKGTRDLTILDRRTILFECIVGRVQTVSGR